MNSTTMKERINDRVYNFFIESNDFNGISLRDISEEFKIDYRDSIDFLKDLVLKEKISIQSSTNPHIIGFRHYPIQSQIEILEQAKNDTIEYKKFGSITIGFESSEFPICIYPSQKELSKSRNLENFGYAHYSKKLAIGEPQLKPFFFDIEVLDRYYNDPRFEFRFEDYSGTISCKVDDLYNPLVRNEDDIYIKSFGLGFDENEKRVAVVFLRYLHNLTGEHQIFWKSKERIDNCKILQEYYQNSIEGNWSFSNSIFSAFLGELKCLNELSIVIFDVNLFREVFEDDKRPREFTFFFTSTSKNYHDFIHLLDKMISENINKAFFNGKVDLYFLKEEEDGIYIKEHKGTLKLLEEWLSSIYKVKGNGSISEVIKPFAKVRKERQKPAHSITENFYDEQFIDLQRTMVSDVYNSMRLLRNIFSQHRKAKDFKIPKWLEEGKIVNF